MKLASRLITAAAALLTSFVAVMAMSFLVFAPWPVKLPLFLLATILALLCAGLLALCLDAMGYDR
jgi:hypothetical protein